MSSINHTDQARTSAAQFGIAHSLRDEHLQPRVSLTLAGKAGTLVSKQEAAGGTFRYMFPIDEKTALEVAFSPMSSGSPRDQIAIYTENLIGRRVCQILACSVDGEFSRPVPLVICLADLVDLDEVFGTAIRAVKERDIFRDGCADGLLEVDHCAASVYLGCFLRSLFPFQERTSFAKALFEVCGERSKPNMLCAGGDAVEHHILSFRDLAEIVEETAERHWGTNLPRWKNGIPAQIVYQLLQAVLPEGVAARTLDVLKLNCSSQGSAS